MITSKLDDENIWLAEFPIRRNLTGRGQGSKNIWLTASQTAKTSYRLIYEHAKSLFKGCCKRREIYAHMWLDTCANIQDTSAFLLRITLSSAEGKTHIDFYMSQEGRVRVSNMINERRLSCYYKTFLFYSKGKRPIKATVLLWENSHYIILYLKLLSNVHILAKYEKHKMVCILGNCESNIVLFVRSS